MIPSSFEIVKIHGPGARRVGGKFSKTSTNTLIQCSTVNIATLAVLTLPAPIAVKITILTRIDVTFGARTVLFV
jgi:hypothetical protein